MFYPWDKCPRWLQHVFARIKKGGGIKGVFIHGGKHIGQWAGRGKRAANVSVLALAGYDQIFICLLVPSSQSRSKNRTGTVSSSAGAPERIPAAVTRRRHPSGAEKDAMWLDWCKWMMLVVLLPLLAEGDSPLSAGQQDAPLLLLLLLRSQRKSEKRRSWMHHT